MSLRLTPAFSHYQDLIVRAPLTSRHQRLTNVARGLYLPSPSLPVVTDRNQAFLHATLIRTAALSCLPRRVDVTGEAALICYGLRTWSGLPPVWFRVPRTSHGRILELPALTFPTRPDVSINMGLVSGSRAIPFRGALTPAFRSSAPCVTAPAVPADLTAVPSHVVSPWTAAVDIALRQHPLVAMFAFVQVLRAHSSLSHFELRRADQRHWQSGQAIFLDALDSWSGRPHVVAARKGVSLANPKLESPGEVLLWWLLHRTGTASWLDKLAVQHPVSCGGKTFFLDVALPKARIAFEFDGAEKFRLKNKELRDFYRRGTALQQAGWKIVHIYWPEMPSSRSSWEVSSAWQKYVANFERELRTLGLPMRGRQVGFWREPDAEVLYPFPLPLRKSS